MIYLIHFESGVYPARNRSMPLKSMVHQHGLSVQRMEHPDEVAETMVVRPHVSENLGSKSC